MAGQLAHGSTPTKRETEAGGAVAHAASRRRPPSARRPPISPLFPYTTLFRSHVRPLDADELRRALAPRGMEIALVVDVGHPGLERVDAAALHLAGLVRRRRFELVPVAHLGLALGLAVDRPRMRVVVRLALLRAVIVVREDAEAELGIFEEDLALRHVVADVLRDERIVLQHVLDDVADSLPSGRARLGLDRIVHFLGEPLQCVAHLRPPHHLRNYLKCGMTSDVKSDNDRADSSWVRLP